MMAPVAEAGTTTSCQGRTQSNFYGLYPFSCKLKGTETHAWILPI